MSEQFPGPNQFESHEQAPVTKEQVIAAYQKVISKGVTSSFEMDNNDPDVVAVNELADRWMAEGDKAAGDDPRARAEFNFEKTFLSLDAGFTNKEDAEEILLEYAQSDIDDIEAEYPDLAKKIKDKVEFYMKKFDITPEEEGE